MIGTSINWLRKNEWAVVAILVLIFLALRLPGVNSPLHQDEYKWPQIVNPANAGGTEIPHPPLSQFIYRTAGEIVGFNVHFRFVPLFFGLLNLLLLYYFLRGRFGKKVAVIGAAFFALSYFSILASLMVDTDGVIMPFFFLIALISYDKIWQSIGKWRSVWIGLLALSCILGFFIKVSFALAICAIAADFLWDKKNLLTKRDIVRYVGWTFAGAVFLALLLFLSQYVFSFFNLKTAFEYWAHFVVGFHRNWFQTGIQVAKALLYSSPFLVLVPFFLEKRDVKKVRPFLFYILFSFIFYIVLFDFSTGALDRYFQFMIVPLCLISGTVIYSIWNSGENRRNKEYILLGTLFSLIFLFFVFIPHFVPSLNPKSAWLSRIFSLKWNFLYPFSGGSGPLGFYVSFLFIALSWIASVVLVCLGIFKPHLRKMAMLVLLPVGLMYNFVFTEEYLFGKINGSAPKLVQSSVEFIKNDPDIKSVVVYNDNGGYDVQNMGKYARRLYADPAFENSYKDFFKTYSGAVLYIDIPRIDPNSFYSDYLKSCNVIYSESDKYITAKILDCKPYQK